MKIGINYPTLRPGHEGDNMPTITYTYGRTIPTKPYGNDRIEITVTEVLPLGAPMPGYFERLRHLIKAEIDDAETERLLEIR